MDAAALIAPQVLRLNSGFTLSPIVAAEIEFYLSDSENSPKMPEFWADVVALCGNLGISLFKTEKEKGVGQHEVALKPSNDPIKIARDIQVLKSVILSAAERAGMTADFSARPFADQPGSGLHIHVHFDDEDGENMFYKDDTQISNELLYSIGGLLAWLPDSMAIFAPQEESYARFTDKSNAPVTVSWGANNRTVAIRLPDSAPDKKRIEHRVAGADADPACVIAFILAAMHDGIKRGTSPGAQIYGDAALPMYDLPKFPKSLEEAKAALKASKLVPGYFNVLNLLPAG